MATHYSIRPPLWLRWWRICLQWKRPGFDFWSEKSPGERNGNLLQYSCLENSIIRRAWQGSYNPWNCKESDLTEGPTPDSLWYAHASTDNSFINLYTMTCYEYVIFSLWSSNRMINIRFQKWYLKMDFWIKFVIYLMNKTWILSLSCIEETLVTDNPQHEHDPLSCGMEWRKRFRDKKP